MLEWKVALLVAVPVVAVPVVAAVSTQHRRGQVPVPAVALVTSAVAAKPTEEKFSVNQTLKKRTL